MKKMKNAVIKTELDYSVGSAILQIWEKKDRESLSEGDLKAIEELRTQLKNYESHNN